MTLKAAIVGRPNVGKSTLFNRLAGRKIAIVHDKPGVTRDRKETEAKLRDIDLQIIDTAGFEYAKDDCLEKRMWQQTERAIKEADVCLFLFDARDGIQPYDEFLPGWSAKAANRLSCWPTNVRENYRKTVFMRPINSVWASRYPFRQNTVWDCWICMTP